MITMNILTPEHIGMKAQNTFYSGKYSVTWNAFRFDFGNRSHSLLYCVFRGLGGANKWCLWIRLRKQSRTRYLQRLTFISVTDKVLWWILIPQWTLFHNLFKKFKISQPILWKIIHHKSLYSRRLTFTEMSPTLLTLGAPHFIERTTYTHTRSTYPPGSCW